MGEARSQLADDQDEYLRLCRKYNAIPYQSPYGGPACYGEHAKSLKLRARMDAEYKAAPPSPPKPKTVWERVSEDDE